MTHQKIVSALIVLLSLSLCLIASGGALPGRILFYSYRDGKAGLYVMDPDGGNLAKLTADGTPEYGASWSPDGKRIAFIANGALWSRPSAFPGPPMEA